MKLKRTQIFIVIFIILAITIVGFLSTVNYQSRAVLGGKIFNIDIADNAFTQKRGLSGRDPLSTNEGMFFVFERLEKHGFWMKDMLFSIDIIWLDENYTITHIEKSVSPETYPKVFYPEKPSLYVLEILANQSDLLGIKVGDKLNILDKNPI
jgi:uncharacterized membrane protein (UPF0127 family)